MGKLGKIGYSGGKFDPSEKDLIKGICAAKSLHNFPPINILLSLYSNVVNIRAKERIKRKAQKATGRNFIFGIYESKFAIFLPNCTA